ncbi:MAG: hypothetical protein Q9165_005567 [Trypethelium subeluteriae]
MSLQRYPTLSSVQQRDRPEPSDTGIPVPQSPAAPAAREQALDTNKGTIDSTISKDETGDAKAKEYRLLARFDRNVQGQETYAGQVQIFSPPDYSSVSEPEPRPDRDILGYRFGPLDRFDPLDLIDPRGYYDPPYPPQSPIDQRPVPAPVTLDSPLLTRGLRLDPERGSFSDLTVPPGLNIGVAPGATHPEHMFSLEESRLQELVSTGPMYPSLNSRSPSRIGPPRQLKFSREGDFLSRAQLNVANPRSPSYQKHQQLLEQQKQKPERPLKKREEEQMNMAHINTGPSDGISPAIRNAAGQLRNHSTPPRINAHQKMGRRESETKHPEKIATAALQQQNFLYPPESRTKISHSAHGTVSGSSAQFSGLQKLTLDRKKIRSVLQTHKESRRSFIPKRITSFPPENHGEESGSGRAVTKLHTTATQTSSSKAKYDRADDISSSIERTFHSMPYFPRLAQAAAPQQRRSESLLHLDGRSTTSENGRTVRCKSNKAPEHYEGQLNDPAVATTESFHKYNDTTLQVQEQPDGKPNQRNAKQPTKALSPLAARRQVPADHPSDCQPSQSLEAMSKILSPWDKTLEVSDSVHNNNNNMRSASNAVTGSSDPRRIKGTQLSSDTPAQDSTLRDKSRIAVSRTLVPIDFLNRLGCPYEIDQLLSTSTVTSLEDDHSREGKMEFSTLLGSTKVGDKAGELGHFTKTGSESQSSEAEEHMSTPSTPQNSQDHSRLIEGQDLRAQIARLQRRVAELSIYQNSEDEKHAPWLALHRVNCQRAPRPATYIDKPIFVRDDDHYHLDGRRRISDEEEWESRQEGAPFVVYLEYFCKEDGEEFPRKKSRRRGKRASERPGAFVKGTQQDGFFSIAQPHFEQIHILSDDLKEAIMDILDSDSDLATYRSVDFEEEGRLTSPYIFHYHFPKEIQESVELNALTQECGEEFQLLQQYLIAQTAPGEREADDLFNRGIVTPKYLRYLYPPGGLLVMNSDDGLVVVRQNGALHLKSSRKINAYASDSQTWKAASISISKVEFDGEFRVKIEEAALDCSYGVQPHVRIQDLRLYPLKYANLAVRDYLRERGQFFYSCKNGRYVVGPGQNDDGLSDVRYMVDALTYNMLHIRKKLEFELFMHKPDSNIVDGHDDEEFVLLLPATIQGFHMQDKKWVKLPVDKLRPVGWNENAFGNLAVDDDTKELVRALVTNKIEADKGTDLVAGKGTGLILLLHGKVVLLDEADVFLEQRSLASLERNALVSVFLRVLEYYDGILLLTSNRVGTFDEAFRSRIQLALHYKSLDEPQRFKIWSNFIQRLEMLGEDIDMGEISRRLPDLARSQMNGRQIRNVVTTARQLAKFRKQRMAFSHLQKVIGVCKRFDDYLVEVKDVVEVEDQPKEEEWARDDGIR